MQIKLNNDAKKAVASAMEKAKMLQHAEVGGEYLLLGALANPSAILADALETMQLNPAKLAGEIESNLPSGSAAGAAAGEIPLSKGAKEVFQAAQMAAQTHHAEEIGPEHILLGILGLAKSTAFILLKGSLKGLDERLKKEINGALERIRKRRAMTNLFNEQASTAIISARSEAEKSRSEFIEPAHILLGITGHPGSVAMAALLRLKVNMKILNPTLQRLVSEAPKRKTKDAAAVFSEDAKRVMDRTVEMSESLKSKYIGPEHFLLGIMSLEGSKAQQALKGAGAPDLKGVMEEIQMVLASANK